MTATVTTTMLASALRLALTELNRFGGATATDQVQQHYDDRTTAARAAATEALNALEDVNERSNDDAALVMQWLCRPRRNSYGHPNGRGVQFSPRAPAIRASRATLSLWYDQSDGTSISGGLDQRTFMHAKVRNRMPVLTDRQREVLRVALSRRGSEGARPRVTRAVSLVGRPPTPQTDARALDAIASTMSAQEWTSDTMAVVAGLVRASGRTVASV